jgi:hypothetical protein
MATEPDRRPAPPRQPAETNDVRTTCDVYLPDEDYVADALPASQIEARFEVRPEVVCRLCVRGV